MDNKFSGISFVVSISPTKFDALGQGDWKKIIELVSLAGYGSIELAIRDSESVNISELQSILEKYKLRLAAIGTGQIYLDEKLSLTDENESVRLETTERLKRQIDLASIFGSFLIIGLIRGNLGKNIDARKVKLLYLKTALIELIDYASVKKVTLLIEPLNRYECDFFNRTEEVINFIKGTDRTNIGILLDTFHMNIEEKNIYNAIAAAGHLLRHIHIADSNRCYPGQGHLNFSEVINALRKIDYSGFLSAEILPLPDLETAITSFFRKMKEMLSA